MKEGNPIIRENGVIDITNLMDEEDLEAWAKIFKSRPQFLFGDIVVINDSHIGVIVKTWEKPDSDEFEYEVYNRMTSEIEMHDEEAMERYRVRHKYLNEEEMQYQNM